MRKSMLFSMLAAFVIAMNAMPNAVSAQNKCLNIFNVEQPGRYSGGTYQLNDNTIIQLGLAPLWNRSIPPLTSFNFAEVKTHPDCFGGPSSLWLNTANLVINISQRKETANHINVNYCDFGGHENVSVGFSAPAQFVDEIDRIHGRQLFTVFGEPVDMAIRRGQQTRSFKEGKLIFKSEIQLSTLMVGGQELFIHSICVND